MNSELRGFAELACATGRFEMFLSPAPPLQAFKTLLELDRAVNIGLFNAKRIRGFRPIDCSKATEKLLDSAGRREGKCWRIDAPSDRKMVAAWKKLLASEVVLDFSEYDPGDVESLIRNLYLPVVHALPLAALEGEWVPETKMELKVAESTLRVAIGGAKGKFCFVGSGGQFTAAVAIADSIPGYMHGYPDSDFREIAKSRRILHPK